MLSTGRGIADHKSEEKQIYSHRNNILYFCLPISEFLLYSDGPGLTMDMLLFLSCCRLLEISVCLLLKRLLN